MAHCFRWKIILSRTKRLGIDTSDHMLYQRDAQHFWLGALNSPQQPPHTHYPAMAAAIVRIIAESATALARHKAGEL